MISSLSLLSVRPFLVSIKAEIADPTVFLTDSDSKKVDKPLVPILVLVCTGSICSNSTNLAHLSITLPVSIISLETMMTELDPLAGLFTPQARHAISPIGCVIRLEGTERRSLLK